MNSSGKTKDLCVYRPVCVRRCLDAPCASKLLTGTVGLHSVWRADGVYSLPVDHLHRVQGHVHVDEDREVLCDLAALHQLQQHLYGNQWVVLHQIGQLRWRQANVVDELRVPLQVSQELQTERQRETVSVESVYQW